MFLTGIQLRKCLFNQHKFTGILINDSKANELIRDIYSWDAVKVWRILWLGANTSIKVI